MKTEFCTIFTRRKNYFKDSEIWPLFNQNFYNTNQILFITKLNLIYTWQTSLFRKLITYFIINSMLDNKETWLSKRLIDTFWWKSADSSQINFLTKFSFVCFNRFSCMHFGLGPHIVSTKTIISTMVSNII